MRKLLLACLLYTGLVSAQHIEGVYTLNYFTNPATGQLTKIVGMAQNDYLDFSYVIDPNFFNAISLDGKTLLEPGKTYEININDDGTIGEVKQINKKEESIEKNLDLQNRYALTAQTDKAFGQNYAVHVTVEGSQSSWGSNVYAAYVNNQQVSVTRVFNTKNRWKFYYNGETYYFRF